MNFQIKNILEIGIFGTGWDRIWNDPIGWFLEFPLLTQILIIIGLIAITIAVLVLVYYILKGLAYFLYYLFKGLYLFLKAIFTGIYKIFKDMYYVISGKSRKKPPVMPYPSIKSNISPEYSSKYQEVKSEKIPYYCTECGQKLTVSMSKLLTSRGIAFCFSCGKEFKLKK
ncbi:MAG: hypothetical protein ACFFD7_14590 [Candidatus Thorarchaeota archaeon]